MKVLGVDPGTAVTGYGIVETNGGPGCGHLVECGVIRLPRTGRLEIRLAELYEGIADLIARHHPTHLALEDAFYHKNVRTTLVLGHARGVVLLAAAQAGMNVAEYSPARVKKTVAGTGAARKERVAMMVAHLLRLRSAPKPSDAADGIAVALTHIIRS